MRTYLYILLFIFFVHEGFSQGLLNPEEEKIISEKMEFGNIYIMQFPFSNFHKPEPNKEIPVGNQIFIEQIGANNNIDAYTSSENSDLELFQYGDSNNISFMIDAKNLDGTIIQNGNNNNAFDFTVNANQDVSANLLQQGDNLHFERYGANSISNNLNIIQTGETRSIIIRNFQ